MPALAIRQDMTATELRRLARHEPDRRAAMRLLAIAHALDGFSRAEAARLAGMERQALRDAVRRYNVYGRPPPCKGVLPTWLASSVRAARVYPASHAA
jgi:hypothetical protein